MRINSPKDLKRIVVIAVISLVVLVFIAMMPYQIKEQQAGVVLTFGKPTSVVYSGLNFKIPFIQTVLKVDTTTRGFAVGYNESTNASIQDESLMITNDFNFVSVDFYIEWRVVDPVEYLYNSDEPIEILKNIAQSSIRSVVGNTDVDSVLTTGKGEIQTKVKEMMTKEVAAYELGIQIGNITIQDAEPPTAAVLAAFKNVESEKQNMDTAINDANKYKNEKIPQARADADKLIQSAEATKETRIAEARGQVARFNAMFEEYIKNPEVTKLRLFYETMEEVMPDLKVIIDDGTGVSKMLPLEPFSYNNNN